MSNPGPFATSDDVHPIFGRLFQFEADYLRELQDQGRDVTARDLAMFNAGFRRGFEAARGAWPKKEATVSEIPSSGELRQGVRDRCDSLEEDKRLLQSALHDAWIDLGQWLQLARHQREVLDHDKTPCPTEHGINATVAVREKISKTLAATKEDL